jgi:hypothetical protein
LKIKDIIVARLLHCPWVGIGIKFGMAEEAVGSMVKFSLICPDCDAVIITSSPEAMVWELCPSCRKHIWDMYDALMADVAPMKPSAGASIKEQFN